MAERTASDRRSDSVSRRNAVGFAAAGIVTTVLPSAAMAATPLAGGSGAGTFSPVLSSLGSASIGTSVRTDARLTFEFRTTSGGSLDAVVWQFDPADPPSAALRATVRASFHLGPPTSPDDATASTPNLGVCEPVDATYDASLQRIVLVAPSSFFIPPGAPPTETSFWIQFYGTAGDVSLILNTTATGPWTSAAGGWSFFGRAGDPGYQYGPTVAIGTYTP